MFFFIFQETCKKNKIIKFLFNFYPIFCIQIYQIGAQPPIHEYGNRQVMQTQWKTALMLGPRNRSICFNKNTRNFIFKKYRKIKKLYFWERIKPGS